MPGSVSFIGGMNVPGVIGRMNASVPLAELVIDGTSLRLRPRAFGRLLMTDFVVPLENIEAAFKLRRTPMTWGVGIRLRDGVLAYFWTFNGDAVIAALAEHAVTIEPGRHRARGLWSLRSSPTAAATLPTLPALLIALTPALLLVSTAVMIALVVTADSWVFRGWIGFVWSVSAVYTVGIWRKSRPRSGS